MRALHPSLALSLHLTQSRRIVIYVSGILLPYDCKAPAVCKHDDRPQNGHKSQPRAVVEDSYEARFLIRSAREHISRFPSVSETGSPATLK